MILRSKISIHSGLSPAYLIRIGLKRLTRTPISIDYWLEATPFRNPCQSSVSGRSEQVEIADLDSLSDGKKRRISCQYSQLAEIQDFESISEPPITKSNLHHLPKIVTQQFQEEANILPKSSAIPLKFTPITNDWWESYLRIEDYEPKVRLTFPVTRAHSPP